LSALKVGLTALLILLNAFFVIAEYALIRSRRSRLEEARAEGLRGAALAVSQQERVGEYISVCQIGVTMASVAIGALGEPTLEHLFKPLFSGLGKVAAIAVAVVIGYGILIITELIAGEMVPKLYAIDRAETLARRLAAPLQFWRLLFSPLVVVTTALSSGILRVFGITPLPYADVGTPQELRRLIAESYAGGALEAGEAGMLSGVFHLHEQEARQVMTPIPAVVTVDISEDAETALRRCVESGHTRLPVTEEEDRDRIKGIVHASALAGLVLREGPHAPINSAVHDALIVPETKPLDDLLADLRKARTQMAVVVDEYGRVVGVVTVEDIVEEVVGEIADETDLAEADVRKVGEGEWLVRGHVAVSDLEDHGLQLPADTDAYNSVGGLILDRLGRLPRRGDVVVANGVSLRVESVRGNRIEVVRIRSRASSSAQQQRS